MANLGKIISDKSAADAKWREERQADKETASALRDTSVEQIIGDPEKFARYLTMQAGDEITLTTKEGTRTYEVTSVAKVTETDRSSLENTSNNCLTLYTCVRDERDLRWCVRAVELTD